MMQSHLLITTLSIVLICMNAFTVPVTHQTRIHSFLGPKRAGVVVMSDSESMPTSPKQEISVEERLEQMATEFITSFSDRLGEDIEPPPELEALAEARDSNAGPQVLATCIYELMIEQDMLYDIDPETGRMTLTEYDVTEHLDTEEVKHAFVTLYTYGINLAGRGILSPDQVKRIVKDRLIARTGKTPEDFDAWLGF